MLAIAYFLTALIIGIAAAASVLAARRRFPSKLPAFNQEELGQDNPADTGVNILRDESSFSERLGKVRFVTSIYHLVNKRH